MRGISCFGSSVILGCFVPSTKACFWFFQVCGFTRSSSSARYRMTSGSTNWPFRRLGICKYKNHSYLALSMPPSGFNKSGRVAFGGRRRSILASLSMLPAASSCRVWLKTAANRCVLSVPSMRRQQKSDRNRPVLNVDSVSRCCQNASSADCFWLPRYRQTELSSLALRTWNACFCTAWNDVLGSIRSSTNRHKISAALLTLVAAFCQSR